MEYRQLSERVTERTLYNPISNILSGLGFQNVSEIGEGKGYIDIACFYGSLKLVIEVKIEDPRVKYKNLLEGVAQGFEYSKSFASAGFIVIEYPSNIRRPLIFKPEIIQYLATSSKVNVMALTEFWTHKYTDITPKDVFNILKEKIEAYIQKQEKAVSLDFVVDTIRDAIVSISGTLRETSGTIDDLINLVVGRFELFAALAEKDPEKLRIAAIDLSSYLLVNQILFYHIYASLTKKIKDLDENNIKSVYDLKDAFKQITDINYKAVYSQDVVSNLPDIDLIVTNIKNIIKAIKATKAALIRTDLIGRIYHESLPYETRKILAAFFTKPVAAEILAGLCIDKSSETIIDPACGSGTLLVEAYKRKEERLKIELNKDILNINEMELLHKEFTQEQIFGFDIMPFSCHLTAVNLSSQNPRTTTNKIQVATLNSLSLQAQLYSKEFKKKGIDLKPFSRVIQETIIKPVRNKQQFFSRDGKVVEAKGAVSAEGIGEGFTLKPVDIVLMNPPFTDRDKIPKEDRIELSNYSKLIKLCGNGVNLWGYFLALSNFLLKDEGKIAGVIPINLARGETTDKIRRFIFENYHVNFWIKPIADFAFSESAKYKDSLFVATKIKPKEGDTVCIVLFKKSLKKINLAQGQEIIETLKRLLPKEGSDFENEYFSARFVKQSEMVSEIDNLMLFVGGSSFTNMDTLRDFLKYCIKKGASKILNLEENMLKEGITSPEGLGQLVYITNPVHKARTGRAFLIMAKVTEDAVIVKIKKTEISVRIPLNVTQSTLRTSTGIRKIDIAQNFDRIIKSEFPDFKTVLTLSKWNGEFDWSTINKKIERLGASRLVIPDKVRLSSENTFVVSIYSDAPLILSNLFYTYKNLEPNKCKILCLSLNSVLTLTQFMTLKSETLGGYIRLSAKDWSLTKQLNYDNLSDDVKKRLLFLFEELRNVNFPSIIEQLERRFQPRVKLDTEVLKCLGFNELEIENILPKIYDALVCELKAIKDMES